MSRLKNVLRSVQMLGPLGVILLCSVVLITLSVNNIFRLNQGVKRLHALGAERFLYQFIGFDLLAMQTSTREYVLYEGGDELSEEFWGKYDELGGFLEELPMFAVSDAADSNSQQIQRYRDEMTYRYEEIVALVDEGEDASELAGESRSADETINHNMAQMVFATETDINESFEQHSQLVWQALTLAIAGLILFPLLASWAFLSASRLTHPLLQITNAVVCIGGSHYRRAMLIDLFRMSNGMGKLSRAVDRMAATLQAQEAALETEIAELQRDLNDSRRRKLMPAGAVRVIED